jgi:hypothetical protein
VDQETIIEARIYTRLQDLFRSLSPKYLQDGELVEQRMSVPLARSIAGAVASVVGSSGSHPSLSGRSTAGSHPATAVSVDTDNFANVLGETDTDVQAALETLDAAAPTPDEKAALPGAGGFPPSGTNKYVTQDYLDHRLASVATVFIAGGAAAIEAVYEVVWAAIP